MNDDDDGPSYKEMHKLAGELRISPNYRMVIELASQLPPEVLVDHGMKIGLMTTLYDVIQCLDRDEIQYKTDDAGAALFGLLAIALRSTTPDDPEFTKTTLQ